LYSVQYSSEHAVQGATSLGIPLWAIVANYLWACNGKVSVSLFCGLFCTCGMHSLGIIQEYRIAGKFGEEFNLANWRGIERIAKLKIAKF